MPLIRPTSRTSGIRTGVRISTVGAKSSAVPTTSTSAMITSMNRIGLSISGWSTPRSSAGMLAWVISHAEASAEATRNITTAVIFAAARKTP